MSYVTQALETDKAILNGLGKVFKFAMLGTASMNPEGRIARSIQTVAHLNALWNGKASENGLPKNNEQIKELETSATRAKPVLAGK